MDLELREKVAVIVGGSRGIGHAAARSATRNWCRCRAVYRSTETLAVVGANGAGKTTMLRTISGLLRPRRGEVRFEGELIDRLPCHRVVERGVVHVPEGRKVFPSLAVRENLELGSYTRAAKARRGRQPRAGLHALSALARAHVPGGRDAVGRRVLR